MDYVYGQSFKMTVFKEDGRLFASDSWYDYTDRQLDELLGRYGIV